MYLYFHIILANEIKIPSLPFNINFDLKNDYYRQRESKYNEEDIININSIKIQTILKLSHKEINNNKFLDDVRQIDKDINRTGYLFELDDDKSITKIDKENIKNALRNILISFAAFNQQIINPNDNKNDKNSSFNLGYTQGYLSIIFFKIIYVIKRIKTNIYKLDFFK